MCFHLAIWECSPTTLRLFRALQAIKVKLVSLQVESFVAEVEEFVAVICCLAGHELRVGHDCLGGAVIIAELRGPRTHSSAFGAAGPD